jgi:hypothetical protein
LLLGLSISIRQGYSHGGFRQELSAQTARALEHLSARCAASGANQLERNIENTARMGYGMTTPDRDSLADGLVSFGEEAIAKRNDASFYDYYTDGNFVTAHTVMAGRFDKEFAYTPIGTVEPNGQQVQWELINIFR